MCHAEDSLHLAADARVVDGHGGTRPICDQLLELPLVEVERVGPDVDEDRFRSTQHEGVGGRDEGEGGQDHLVARLDVE